nr:MAG TPA: hypothetical protein [Microviridae sp.]
MIAMEVIALTKSESHLATLAVSTSVCCGWWSTVCMARWLSRLRFNVCARSRLLTVHPSIHSFIHPSIRLSISSVHLIRPSHPSISSVHLISSHLISSHLISSHLISSHLYLSAKTVRDIGRRYI